MNIKQIEAAHNVKMKYFRETGQHIVYFEREENGLNMVKLSASSAVSKAEAVKDLIFSFNKYGIR